MLFGYLIAARLLGLVRDFGRLPEVQPRVSAGPERGDAALPGRTHGRNRLVRANPTHPATAALTQLLELSFGPQIVIGEEFALPQVEQVVIFGSWADRHHGSPGPPPHDVDVLVIGTPERAAIYDAADRAQVRLGLQVNPDAKIHSGGSSRQGSFCDSVDVRW